MAVIAFLALVTAGFWLLTPSGVLPVGASAPDQVSNPADVAARLAALARAKVFTTGPVHPSSPLPEKIECRFRNTPVSGTTPKFDCRLADGENLRVKYGSREVKAEVAATTLLKAVGFGGDDVSMVGRVRCYGCPRWPFHSRQVAERLHLEKLLEDHIDYDRFIDFDWVAVERRDRRHELEFGNEEGWAFHELSKIDSSVGGATPAEVDALRLMAMFLSHWDNKASNQSLACPSESACDHPLALLQDVGSTFGPRKIDLETWSETPVWSDPSTCTISMKGFPYGGATFTDARISEEGRRLLADRLEKLSPSQIRALFTTARFENVDGWVAAFERRVKAIARRPPCP